MFPSGLDPFESYQPILLLYPVLIIHLHSVGQKKAYRLNGVYDLKAPRLAFKQNSKTARLVLMFKFVLPEDTAHFLEPNQMKIIIFLTTLSKLMNTTIWFCLGPNRIRHIQFRSSQTIVTWPSNGFQVWRPESGSALLAITSSSAAWRPHPLGYAKKGVARLAQSNWSAYDSAQCEDGNSRYNAGGGLARARLGSVTAGSRQEWDGISGMTYVSSYSYSRPHYCC